MGFLHLLEQLRTPVLTAILSAITYCGDELFFMVLALTVFWCISKREGYYLLLTGFLGTVVSQWLKLAFRIPRPWVLDPSLTLVEAARAGATGYSFPSGHTQNIVGTMTCLLLWTKRTWVRIAAAVLLVLVPFSRMYLGCHTPLDVGVATVLAVAIAAGLYPLLRRTERNPRILDRLLLGALVLTLCYWAYVTFARFPADVDPDHLYEGTKNAYTLLGCLIGLLIAHAFDEKKLHFSVEAVWWAQLLKVGLGLLLILGVRVGLKPVLNAVLPVYPAAAVRYCLMVVFAGCVWPLTFPWFARLGRSE